MLPGTSTVFEYLLFNAALRMPKNVHREEKEKRVFDVIQQLGLSKITHSFIGDQFTRGISGYIKIQTLLIFLQGVKNDE